MDIKIIFESSSYVLVQALFNLGDVFIDFSTGIN